MEWRLQKEEVRVCMTVFLVENVSYVFPQSTLLGMGNYARCGTQEDVWGVRARKLGKIVNVLPSA